MPLPAIAGLRPDADINEIRSKINSLIEEIRQLLLSLDSLNVPSLVASYISTADGTYPRVDLSHVGNIFTAYADAINYISINPSSLGNPTIKFADGTDGMNGFLSFTAGLFLMLAQGGDINIYAQSGDIILTAGNNVRVANWSKLMNNSTSKTLQQELDSKANISSTSGTVYVATTPGGPANTPISFSGGIRVS